MVDLHAKLGDLEKSVGAALHDLHRQAVPERIWQRDFRVWSNSPNEIANRLGWLDAPGEMSQQLDDLVACAAELQRDGFQQALLMGMGGSSLAPEVFQKSFGTRPGYLDLSILDSTHPQAILEFDQRDDPKRRVYIVSTKSGGTVETLSFLKYFYNRVQRQFGLKDAGRFFIAITDPASGLESLARQLNFRRIFLNNPDIGGRYSALSAFGLIPAALVGVELKPLLDRALSGLEQTRNPDPNQNPALLLGAILGASALAGRDKLTLVCSPALESFGDWLEQLIAESTGKDGTGILPVVGEPIGGPNQYGNDRLFVRLALRGDQGFEPELLALETAGHPVVRIEMDGKYDLGEQFFLWEMAVAVAGHCLGIQPFDQPNVEAAKILARELVADYQKTGRSPEDEAAAIDERRFVEFLSSAMPGDYLALQAYLAPGKDLSAALQRLRIRLRDRTRLATTTGYGPRFLHSTGQLHKGDRGNGLFIQFCDRPKVGLVIPDRAGEGFGGLTFDVLVAAQGVGDLSALRSARPPRRAIRFVLGADPVAQLDALRESL